MLSNLSGYLVHSGVASLTHTDNCFCHGTRPPTCNTCGEWGSSGHPGISGEKKAVVSTWWFDLPSDKVYLVAVGITTITFYRLECLSQGIERTRENIGISTIFLYKDNRGRDGDGRSCQNI